MGRLGGFVRGCRQNMLGAAVFENVQPETTGRGTASILTTVGSGGSGFGIHTAPTALYQACSAALVCEAGIGGTAAGSGVSRSSIDTSSSSNGVPSGYFPDRYAKTLTKSFRLNSKLSKSTDGCTGGSGNGCSSTDTRRRFSVRQKPSPRGTTAMA